MPNHAAYPIVTRYDPETGQLQMVAIKQSDTSQWAIPGGMVNIDAGEWVSDIAKLEFKKKVVHIQDPDFDNMMGILLTNGIQVQVYRGYDHNTRNTDNALMRATTFHFHCRPDIATQLQLQPGDDAINIMWLNVDETDEQFNNLHESHKKMVFDAIIKTGLPLKINPVEDGFYYQDKNHLSDRGGYWKDPGNNMYWKWNSKDVGYWTKW